MPDTSARHPRPHCPQCDGSLRRVRRTLADRLGGWVGLRRPRYRCPSKACGWTGRPTLPRAGPTWRQRVADRLRPAPFFPAGLLGGLAIGFAGVASWQALRDTTPWVQVGSHRVALGTSHDGDPLPAGHRWRRPTASAATHATPPAAQGRGTAPALALRQHCAWGVPGRSPYRGTVEEALAAARLPQEAIVQIAAGIREGRVVDRLTITNVAIRTDAGGREFNPRRFAMSYGRTMCADSRVNFAPGHSERASLYEAVDDQGRKHSVMVPDVCGNVSVLGSEEEDDWRLAQSGGDADGTVRVSHADLAGGDPADAQTVSEPATLGCVALALAIAAGASARRARRTPGRSPTPDPPPD